MNQWQVEFRKRRGQEIADRYKIVKEGDGYSVPSETKPRKKYEVIISPTDVSCTCQDHLETGQRCKHIYAVEFFLQGNQGGDPPVGPRRPTYPRNYSAINAAQTREEDEFEPLLFQICQSITEPPHVSGRRPIPLRDAIFAIVSKVYSGKSARRFIPRLTLAYRRGYLEKPLTFGAISAYLEKPGITSILEDLIVRSSVPMAPIETIFAIDSTGMSGSRFINWRDIKYRGIVEKMWAKLHVMIGTKTLIVTAAFIGDRDASDTVQLPRLLETTARNFTIRELCADKAYNTRRNQEIIAAHGIRAYIPFKDNHAGKGGGVWTDQFLRWRDDREEFDKHYHLRSKIEAAFMSMKTNFGDSLRSRTETAMRNEALAKLLCHNLACLNKAMDRYKIGTEFLTAALEAAE